MFDTSFILSPVGLSPDLQGHVVHIGHIGGYVEKLDFFFPYDPFEESVTVAQAQETRVYGQLAMTLAWQRHELFSLTHATALDKVVTYSSYLEEIIRNGKPSHSQREQRLLAAHYRQAQQLFCDYLQNRLLKNITDTAVDLPPLLTQRPLMYRSWIFDNGHYILLVFFDGSHYQLYSADFNYRQRFQTRQSLAFAQIVGFVHAFFKWCSDSEAYTTYTVVDNFPQPVINHLKAAPFWTPERVA